MKAGSILKTLIVTAAVLMVLTGLSLAGEVSLVGQVNDSYQLLADGQIYEIADDELGNELAENISATVQVTGTVELEDDMKILVVTAYKVISD